MDSLERRNRSAAISWAHYVLAVTKKRERHSLQKRGVHITFLVDADIMIGQSNPAHQAGLFEDLLETETAQHYSAPLNAFFYDWVFENLHQSQRDGDVVWGAAPEHFRELINKANTLLDEAGTDNSPLLHDDLGDSDALRTRLDAVLEALERNPWSNVSKDVAELLGILGVSFDAPSQWEVIDSLKQWLDCLSRGGHVPGARAGRAARRESLNWPRFEADDELAILRAWRARLWAVRHDRHEVAFAERAANDTPPRTKNIDADARVLAALTLLNRDWKKTNQRVELLTASKYLLRAVSGSALIPSLKQEEPDDPASGAMADFVHMPSMILAEESLWEPVKAERDAGAETIAEWGMPRVEEFSGEPARWFALINGSNSSHSNTRALPWHTSVDDLHANVWKLGGSFKKFFSQKVSKSVALAHVRDRLGMQRGAMAARTREQLQAHSIEQLGQKTAALFEYRRIQLRVDMLEYLIQAHYLKQEWDADSGSVNPLRSPPYVDFGEPDYTRRLRDALVARPPLRAPEIQAIKLQVFEHDPSTYKLALAYASVYATQSLWRLAASAAEYAFWLSQTSEYRSTRPEKVLGDEARLLQLSCLRRAAQTRDQLDKPTALLEDFRRFIPQIQKAEPLFGVRLELEHSSLTLTRLLMEFFESTSERSQHDFRSKVSEALHELVELETANAGSLEPQESDPKYPTLLDIADRVSSNICNLAWLAVGWSVGELNRSAMLMPRKDSLGRYHTELVVELVHRSLKSLAASANARISTWREKPSHDLLTTFTACMILAPELLNLSDTTTRKQMVEALEEWCHHKYEHPYDLQRIQYALQLSKIVRF